VIDQLAALLFIHDPLCRRQKLGRLNDADGGWLEDGGYYANGLFRASYFGRSKRAKKFVEQVAEPGFEDVDLGLRDGNALGPPDGGRFNVPSSSLSVF
jgi:hypothetical protein